MTRWFKNPVHVWLLSAAVDFSLAAFQVGTGFDVLPGTAADAAILGALGVVSFSVACFFHVKAPLT